MADISVTVPHKYFPRSYQSDVFEAYQRGIKRYAMVWHRRSGKDTTALNFCICRMLERVGQYWHIFPTYTQGQKAIWDGYNREGMPFLDYFPPELVEHKDNNDLEIKLINGSIYKVIGSDKVDSLVGANPAGLIFSEYSLQTPEAWEKLSPILVENQGWAMFIFTPRGQNHAFKLAQHAEQSPQWFFSKHTIDDTHRDAQGEDGRPVIVDTDLDDERAQGADEDFLEQEYRCSFAGFRTGSYFGKEMAKASTEGRITNIPWEPRLLTFTVWDLGMDDATAIWFGQRTKYEIRWIDYYEASGEGLPHFFKLVREKRYIYSNHYAPHDIEVRELSSGKSRKQIAQELGFNFQVVPKIPFQDGINQVRMILPRSWFDRVKCNIGIQGLINYHKEYVDKLGTFKPQPVHDKSSHPADAFRYASIIVDRETEEFVRPMEVVTDFDVFANTGAKADADAF